MKRDVLIANGSLALREELQTLFERAQLSTTSCASASEMRHALGSHAYALVVLGIVLSDGDGLELLKTIKAARTPVLLLSSKTAVASRILALGVGPDDYAEPPVACHEAAKVPPASRSVKSHVQPFLRSP